MASITSPDYPGERLMVCRNPELARLRARKREDLLSATERHLAPIREAVRRARNPLRGKTAIALKVGAVLNKHKMAKHFETTIEDDRFDFRRKAEAIAEEAALDGFYVVRTNLPTATLDDAGTVAAYKRLSGVERVFRSLKTVDLEVRPIFHWASPRVKAHVLLCMLAYYVEHHMRARLGPLLYDDTDREAAAKLRNSVVAKAQRSPAARRKETTGRTEEGLPVQSFQSLLADLATYCRMQAATPLNENYVFTLYSRPTQTQARAFELLDAALATDARRRLTADWTQSPDGAGASNGSGHLEVGQSPPAQDHDRACLVLVASPAGLGVEPLVSGAGRHREGTDPPDRHRRAGPQTPRRLVALCHPRRRSRGRRVQGGMTR